MVIYQKQHRLAHRQYCVPLSESRLTRFPPPSKKAFFPSSHIFRVNSKRIIKTLFSSKCSSINFRNSLHLKRRDEKISAPEHATEKVALLPGSEAAATERDGETQRERERETSLQGDRSAPAATPNLALHPAGPVGAWSCRHPKGCRGGVPRLCRRPRGWEEVWGRKAVPPASPALKDGRTFKAFLFPPPQPSPVSWLILPATLRSKKRGCPWPCQRPAFLTFLRLGPGAARCGATAAPANICISHRSPRLTDSPRHQHCFTWGEFREGLHGMWQHRSELD